MHIMGVVQGTGNMKGGKIASFIKKKKNKTSSVER